MLTESVELFFYQKLEFNYANYTTKRTEFSFTLSMPKWQSNANERCSTRIAFIEENRVRISIAKTQSMHIMKNFKDEKIF